MIPESVVCGVGTHKKAAPILGRLFSVLGPSVTNLTNLLPKTARHPMDRPVCNSLMISSNSRYPIFKRIVRISKLRLADILMGCISNWECEKRN
jgi:hypothetical protein